MIRKNNNALLLLLLVASLAVPLGANANDQVDNGSTNQFTTAPWSQFNDPVLNKLVNKALRGNLGIRAARARIDQAEAQAQSALTPLHPSVWAETAYSLNSFDASSSGMSATATPGMPPAPTTTVPYYRHVASATLRAQYNIDITGRYYKARQATVKEMYAVQEDAQSHAMAIASLLVQTYYDVAAAKMRVRLIEQQIENYEKLLGLVMAQFNVGSATSLDVLQQRAQLESKRAQLPLAKAIIESGKLQLAALLGDSKTDQLPEIPAALPTLTSAPTPSSEIGTEALIRARPELRAAELRIDALEEQKISAKRALLPSLSLNGQLGYQWSHLTETTHGEAWSIGAALSIPLYMGGSNRTALRQIKATERSAKYSFENSVLESKTRILSTLENEKAQQAYLLALREQTKAAEQTVREATKRYVAGLSSYLNVLTANDALQFNQLNLLQAERNLLSARIAVLEAMGGKWTRKLITN